MVLHGLLEYGRKLNERILSSKRDPESPGMSLGKYITYKC
jgi:hypothetical protein